MAFTGFLESSNLKRKMEFPDVSNFGATFFFKRAHLPPKNHHIGALAVTSL
jgi:hypothetical protein